MNTENKIVELSQAVMGRRKIKMVLHEIYPDRQKWNHNGITYLEQYTRDNADSIKGMPLCAEFLDSDKDIPYGHGLTGYIKNMPVFQDSVQVGTFETWSIEDVEIDNEKHRCLCATGYINSNRYPNFVRWLEKQIESGNTIYGSVEMSGTRDNDGEIIYEDGWKEKGRVPMIYDYIGHSIISITPADDAALVTAFEMVKGEFDDVFDEKKTEKCTLGEFDDIFDMSESTAVTDNWGFGIVDESREKVEKPLNKKEYDSLIVAGLLKPEDKDINFDNVFWIK